MDGFLSGPAVHRTRDPRGHETPGPLYEGTVNMSCWKANQMTTKERQNDHKEMPNDYKVMQNNHKETQNN